MLLFVVSGNHVVLMQSTSVRERTLENHLLWLLQQAQLLGEGQAPSLNDQPTRAALEAAATSPVRSIEVLADFDASGSKDQQRTMSRSVWQLFNGLMDGGAVLPLEDLDSSRVGLVIQLKYEGRRHETNRAALDRLGRVLRHADGVNVRVHLDNGSTFENEQLRTSGKIQVLTTDGLPSLVDSYDAMRGWLRERLGEDRG